MRRPARAFVVPAPDASGRLRPARPALRRGWALACLLAGLGCAPLQQVDLRVEPAPASLWVDGEAVDPVPASLALRADRDHKLYFKSPGYHPELIVVRSVPGDAGPRLDPERVAVRLRPLAGGGRDVRIEREDAPDP